MPRASLDDILARLKEVRSAPHAEESLAFLREVFDRGPSAGAARAAKLVGELEIAGLEPELARAFDRFMASPSRSDKGCLAKTEIARALYRLESSNAGLFLAGARHVQMEPVWGGQADVAAHLRGECAMGLVRCNYSDVWIVLSDHLADPQQPVRLAAARAIGYSQDDRGVPLLRLKALVGDSDPAVLSECFASMLSLSPEPSLPFVMRFTDWDDEPVAEAAALALGAWGREEAFEPLVAWWRDRARGALRTTALLAIGMLRHKGAVDFLVSLLESEPGKTVTDALTALEIHRQDPDLCERVLAAIAQRDDLRLGPDALTPFEGG